MQRYGATLALAGGALLLGTASIVRPGWAQTVQTPPTPPVTDVVVTGQHLSDGQIATQASVGLLGDRNRLDTPFSTTSVTDTLIRDLQAHTLSEILADDPSVRSAVGADVTDQVAIRGFTVESGDTTLNGLPGIAQPRRFYFDSVSRVDLIRGPGGLLFGQSPGASVGGTINYVTKEAESEPLTRLTAGYQSESNFGGSVDLGRRFGEGEPFGVRINASYRDGDSAFHDQRQREGGVAAKLDYRSDSGFSIAADVGYYDLLYAPPLGGPDINSNAKVPPPPRVDATLAPTWQRFPIYSVYGMVRARQDLWDGTYVTAAYGHSYTSELSVQGLLLSSDSNGNVPVLPSAFPYWQDNQAQDVQVHTKFATGPLHHDVALIGDFVEQTDSFVFDVLGPITTVSIYQPINLPAPDTSRLDRYPPKTGSTFLASGALADIISIWDDRISILAGVRRQHIESASFDHGARTGRQVGEAWTPGFGLVLHPLETVSIYGNYIQGLTPGPTPPSSAFNANQTFAPTVSDQYEVGAKYQRGKFGTQIAVFQITKQTGALNPATNIFGILGRQRNRGVEAQVYGDIADGFRLNGGISALDGRLSQTAGGVYEGHKAPGEPDVQFTLAPEIDVPFVSGLTITGRVIYTSRVFYDAANTQTLPGWSRYDLGARYVTRIKDQPVIMRLNTYNLTNSNFWESNGRALLGREDPRSFRVSVETRF